MLKTNKNFVFCLLLISLVWVVTGEARCQPQPQSTSETAPGLFATGHQDSTMVSPVAQVLESYETTNVFVISLYIDSAETLISYQQTGLTEAQLGVGEYEIGDDLLEALRTIGAPVEILHGVTIHRFSYGDQPIAELASPTSEVLVDQPAEVALSTGNFYLGSGTVNDSIPDLGWAWRWVQVAAGSGAPVGAQTTNLKYRLRIHNDSSPANIYCGDYEVYLSSTARGGAIPHFLVYNNLGGRTDGGFDDDTADDSDIYLNLRQTSHFNGEDPNQRWYVYIQDTLGGDTGFLQYIEFQVFWDAPDMDFVATDIHLRDQPSNGGNRIDSPQVGQQLYPHFFFSLNGTSPFTGTVWRIQRNGSTLCSFSGTLTPGGYVGSCTSPWTVTAGLHNFNGTADPNDTLAESNENNNQANRNYTVSENLDIRITPLSLDFDDNQISQTAESVYETTTPTRKGVAPALNEKAKRVGRVRVLVGLDTPFQSEGSLLPQAALEQRERIAQVQERLLQKLQGHDFTVHARYRFINYMALEVNAAALEALERLPEARDIEEDLPQPPTMSSSNPVIGSDDAWAAGYDGTGQTVAILDTGVDKSHSFFTTGGNKVVSEACFSTTSAVNSSTSVCPGGVAESTASGSGVNCSTSIPGCDHGTHVAGSAAGNNGIGPHYGVGRGAQLIAVQVFSRFDSVAICGFPPCALSYTSDQIKGLERVYALRNTYDIASVNMSLGGGSYSSQASCDSANSAIKAAIDNLRAVDIATVIAAGNDSSRTNMSAPGCISSAVSVGATTDGDAVASFSNVATFLDLLAPGVSITSSIPGGGTGTKNGTSMATPHVAGAWAVLKQAKPAATVDEILGALRATGTSVDDNRSGGTVNDLRRINVLDAVNAIAPTPSGSFTIFNDGGGPLSISSIQLDSTAPWITWSPQAPFSIGPGGSQVVQVNVDFGQAPSGQSSRRLLVYSNDPEESPYPGGVFINVSKQSANPVLTVTRAGTGSGQVTSSPSGISCGSDCSQSYTTGTVVTLTALPAAGSAFAGWSGAADCSDGSVTMNASKSCTATFNVVSACSTNLTMTNQTVTGGIYRATVSISAGPGVTIDGTGSEVRFVVGGRVVLNNGVAIHGNFVAETSANPCP